MPFIDMDRPRLRVDFNELVQADLVLLAKTDTVQDLDGNTIDLAEGLPVFVYEFNHYDDGDREFLLADGVAELNRPDLNGAWTKAAKWCCRIDKHGIKNETTRSA